MSEANDIAPILALDIGRVCVHLRHDECAAAYGVGSFSEALKTYPDLFKEQMKMERGEITTDQFMIYLQSLIPEVMDLDAVRETWRIIIGPEIEGMADLIEEVLNLGIRPVFFSNISDIHFERTLSFLSFKAKVPDAILSCEVGSVKPEPGIYAALESQYCGGGRPLLYVDDKPENIEAGRDRAWTTYTMGTVEGLREALHKALGAL